MMTRGMLELLKKVTHSKSRTEQNAFTYFVRTPSASSLQPQWASGREDWVLNRFWTPAIQLVGRHCPSRSIKVLSTSLSLESQALGALHSNSGTKTSEEVVSVTLKWFRRGSQPPRFLRRSLHAFEFRSNAWSYSRTISPSLTRSNSRCAITHRRPTTSFSAPSGARSLINSASRRCSAPSAQLRRPYSK